MATSKKTRVRMGWSGDEFHAGGLRFDGEGAWDPDGKPVTFTEKDAEQVIEAAKQSGVTLVVAEDPEAEITPPGVPGSGQEG